MNEAEIVKDLLFRASDQDGIGWTPTTVVHVPAGLLHRAADEIERLRAKLALFACDCAVNERCAVPDNCRNFQARRMLERPHAD